VRVLTILARNAFVLALTIAALPQVDAEETARSVSISCDIFEIRADRGKTRISSPDVHTLEGQPAIVEVGRQFPPIEIEAGRKVHLKACVRCQFIAYCLANGKVKLDLDVNIPELAGDDDDEIVIQSTGVRMLRTIDWGQRTAVSIRNAADKETHVIELTVTEAALEAPHEPPPDAVPPPPPGRWLRDAGRRGDEFRPVPGPRIR
jgi:hypothetical protein